MGKTLILLLNSKNDFLLLSKTGYYTSYEVELSSSTLGRSTPSSEEDDDSNESDESA